MTNPNGHHWWPNAIIYFWIKTIFFCTLPLSIRCPAHQITYYKTHFNIIFLFRIRPFCEKRIILICHSSYGKFLEAGNWQNPLCWIRTTSQVAWSQQPALKHSWNTFSLFAFATWGGRGWLTGRSDTPSMLPELHLSVFNKIKCVW